MKCHTCPDISSGHLSGVYLLIFTWVCKNLVCLYHIYSHKTRFHQILKKNIFWAGKNVSQKWCCFLHFEEHTARFWECRMFSDFCFGHFLCKNIFSRGKGLDKKVIFSSLFLHLPTTITMTKTENRDLALIFQIWLSMMILRKISYKNLIDFNF